MAEDAVRMAFYSCKKNNYLSVVFFIQFVRFDDFGCVFAKQETSGNASRNFANVGWRTDRQT
jgi:hypothetical protein